MSNERHILIAVTRNPDTNERQSFQVGRPTNAHRANDRFEGHADRQFYRESTYTIAGLPVDHFAVRSTADKTDHRLRGIIPVRLKDMVKHDRSVEDHIARPASGMGSLINRYGR